eukprot:Nk52_evm1s2293 gene=Nk52_evmTU1s2293
MVELSQSHTNKKKRSLIKGCRYDKMHPANLLVLLISSSLSLFLLLSRIDSAWAYERVGPNRHLMGRLILPEESLYFNLVDLKPNAAYEIKISYPSAYPTTWEIAIVPDSSFSPTSFGASSGRSLLNVDKIIIATDEQALVKGISLPLLHVTAHFDAYTVNPSVQNRQIPFNI